MCNEQGMARSVAAVVAVVRAGTKAPGAVLAVVARSWAGAPFNEEQTLNGRALVALGLPITPGIFGGMGGALLRAAVAFADTISAVARTVGAR